MTIDKKIFCLVGIILFAALYSIYVFVGIRPVGMLIITPILGIASGYLYLAIKKYGSHRV